MRPLLGPWVVLAIGVVAAEAQPADRAGSGAMTCQAWFSASASQQDREKWLLDDWAGVLASDPLPIPRAELEKHSFAGPLNQLRMACAQTPSANIEEAARRLLDLTRIGAIPFD